MNVTGPNGAFVQGSGYALDKRRYRSRSFGRNRSDFFMFPGSSPLQQSQNFSNQLYTRSSSNDSRIESRYDEIGPSGDSYPMHFSRMSRNQFRSSHHQPIIPFLPMHQNAFLSRRGSNMRQVTPVMQLLNSSIVGRPLQGELFRTTSLLWLPSWCEFSTKTVCIDL